MKKNLRNLTIIVLLLVPLGVTAQMTDLIISEYGEGAGNNDYLELYNGTGADVDLSMYYMRKIINEGEWYERQFQLKGILKHGHTLNIVKYTADSALYVKVDTVGAVIGVEGSSFTFMVSNGNEAFALAKVLSPGDTVIIDKIGEASETEPPSWDCAGVVGAGKEHTWARKPEVTGPNADWLSSAGTNSEDSEWIIYPHNYWDNLGFHTEYNSAPASEIFFSEYGDYGNNDYLEIYNGTGGEVDMSNYVIRKIINEGDWGERDYFLEGILPHGKAFTIIKYNADSALLVQMDTTGPVQGVGGSDFTFMVTNGNEAFGLARINAPGDTVIIDKIGEPSETEPPSWDVAGVTGGAKDHVLIRKNNVGGPNADWASSAGTTPENSEWIVRSPTYWRDVGKHSMYLGPATPSVDVTFAVDMSQETVSAGVYLAGNFQGWDPAATPMEDPDVDGVYTVTVSLEVNKTYEYKFVNGSNWESVPGACAQNGNRYVNVVESPIDLETVCFGSCGACAGIYNVTFRVDMSQQTVSGDGVHIAGGFQGWDPAATLMDDSDSDGIYEYTTQLGGNSSYEFKFVNGASWGFEESVPAACAVNNNRSINVGTEDLVTDAYCFGSCTECSVGISDREMAQTINIYPNPSGGEFEISLDLRAPDNLQIVVYTVTGKRVQNREVTLPAGMNTQYFNIDQQGVYIIEVSGTEGRTFRKVVID